MNEYVQLLGASDVKSAGHAMERAAESMSRMAATIDGTFENNARRMEEWLTDFRILVERLEIAMKGPPT